MMNHSAKSQSDAGYLAERIDAPNPRPPKIWTVCQVHSKRAHRVVAEAAGLEVGAFIPTYHRVRYVDGQRTSSERQLMPGYLFLKLAHDDHHAIKDIEGVHAIIGLGEWGAARLDRELVEIDLKSKLHVWDDIEGAPVSRERSRKSRPSRRIRRRERWRAIAVG